MKKFAAATLALALLVSMLCSCHLEVTLPSDLPKQDKVSPSQSVPVSPSQSAPVSPPAADTSPSGGANGVKDYVNAEHYEPGVYKVGSDLPAGIYVAFSTGSTLSFLSVKDGSGSDAKTLAADTFKSNSIIEVFDGQYLDFSNSVLVLAKNTAGFAKDIFNENGYYTEGMYWVGYHIAAGEYTITAVDDASLSMYTIYGDATRDDILSINVMSGKTGHVTLEDGQFIELDEATMSPA